MNARTRAAARYGMVARAYAEHWAPVLVGLTEPLLRALPPLDGTRAVDLGAGTGAIADLMRARGATTIALDATHGMLAEANGLNHRVVADATKLPLTTESVDVCVSTFVLQHIPSPQRVFHEAARVLKHDGAAATATWSADADETGPPYDVVDAALNNAGATAEFGAITTWHARVNSPSKIRRYARTAGFRSIEAWIETGRHAWTPDTFIGWAASLGPYGRRFATLDPETRNRALAEAERGLANLTPDDLVWSPGVVYCVARR